MFPKTKRLVPKNPHTYTIVSVGVVVAALALFVIQIVYYYMRWDCNQGWGPVGFTRYLNPEYCDECKLTLADSFRLGNFQVDTVIGLENDYSQLYEFYNDTGRNCSVLVREALDGDEIEPEIAAAELYAFEYESEAYCETFTTKNDDGTLDYEQLCNCEIYDVQRLQPCKK